MQLQRLVDHPEAGVGREALAHGGGLRRLGRLGVQQRRRAPDQESRGIELGRHVGELELSRLEVGQRLAELLALHDIARRRLQAGTRAAQRAGADVDAPSVETHHRDLEAVPLGAEPVGDRHLAILEDHRGRRLAVPAELVLLLAERQAGRPRLDHQGRDAAGSRSSGAQHHDIDVAPAAARDEGLAAVQHVMVALQFGTRRQRRRIRACARLGEAIAREMLHGAEPGQEPPALIVVAESVDHPGGHVVDRDVGRRAGTRRRQLFHDQSRIEPAEAAAADVVAHVDAAEAECRRFAQHLLRKDFLGVPARGLRQHAICRELPGRVPERLLVF